MQAERFPNAEKNTYFCGLIPIISHDRKTLTLLLET